MQANLFIRMVSILGEDNLNHARLQRVAERLNHNMVDFRLLNFSPFAN